MTWSIASISDLPWPRIVNQAIPMLVYAGGVAVAVVNWRKHPGVSLVAAVVLGLLLGWSIWALHTESEFHARVFRLSQQEMYWQFWLRNIPYHTAFMVLAFTAFLRPGRKDPVVIVREEVPHV